VKTVKVLKQCNTPYSSIISTYYLYGEILIEKGVENGKLVLLTVPVTVLEAILTILTELVLIFDI